MRSFLTVFAVLIMCLIVLSCKKDEPVDPVIDERYFKAFSIKSPLEEILFDTIDKVLFAFSKDGGEILKYDYRLNKILARASKKGTIDYYEFAIGRYNGVPEVYVGEKNKIFIYDGETLQLKDSIKVFDPDDKYFYSMTCGGENLIFISVCNGSGPGFLTIDRNLKLVVSGSAYGVNCSRIKAYTSPLTGNVEVISVGGSSYYNGIIIQDKFEEDGLFLESITEYFPQLPTSKVVLETSDEADFIITHEQGNLFSKDSLKLIGSLEGLYNDFVIIGNGETIIGVTTGRTIHFFDYPYLTRTRTENIEGDGLRAFIDDGKLISFSIKYGDDPIKRDVYISKIIVPI